MVPDMSARLHRLLEEEELPLHGFVPFEDLSDALLPCRAASRLKEIFPPDFPPRTVIVALFPYRFSDEPGNLARYARVSDYHISAGSVLEKAAARLRNEFSPHRFLPFIDNSPIPEVRAAALAGLGCIGRHGLLIHPEFGSFVFIGTIVTDLVISNMAYEPSEGKTPAHCPGCGACAAACPGHCLSLRIRDNTPGTRETCLSRISQKKGLLTPEETQLLKENNVVWGCDRCQDACPLNVNTRIDPHPCFTEHAGPDLTRAALDALETLDGKAYGWRGRAVLERNLSLFE